MLGIHICYLLFFSGLKRLQLQNASNPSLIWSYLQVSSTSQHSLLFFIQCVQQVAIKSHSPRPFLFPPLRGPAPHGGDPRGFCCFSCSPQPDGWAPPHSSSHQEPSGGEKNSCFLLFMSAAGKVFPKEHRLFKWCARFYPHGQLVHALYHVMLYLSRILRNCIPHVLLAAAALHHLGCNGETHPSFMVFGIKDSFMPMIR